ncbi:MAG: hypothetical protein ACF8TS_13725, partial [Maioricimonas sp. JB049]
CTLHCDCSDGRNAPVTPPSNSSSVDSLRFVDLMPSVDTLADLDRPGTARAAQDGQPPSSTIACGVNVLNCVWQI